MKNKVRENSKKKIHNFKIENCNIKIMTYVMLVVILITLIAATVAWYQTFYATKVSDMQMTTADSETIKVEIKPAQQTGETQVDNFVTLMQGQEDSVLADINMPVFDNVESYETVSKMAPGVYGELIIRLTALHRDINHYRIIPEAVFRYIDGTEISESKKETLNNLAKGHILFFAKRESIENKENVNAYTHNKKYVFSELIDAETPMSGSLFWNDAADEGQPKEVKVYWYWPYEYSNLSESIQKSVQIPVDETELNGILQEEKYLRYFDQNKMQDLVSHSVSWNETQLYDFADTSIGTYVNSIQIHLKVDGYHEAGEGNTEG